MAGDTYDYTPPTLDDDDQTNSQILAGLMSPASAQSLVLPPPSSPAVSGPGQSTPQTGSIATAPSQAQPRISGPAMLPGIATKPENLNNGPATLAPRLVAITANAQRGYSGSMPSAIGSPGVIHGTPSSTTQVTEDPLAKNLGNAQTEYNRVASTGAGVDQVKNRWGRVLGKVADVAGSVLAPGVAQFTPGSTLNHQRILGQDAAQVGAAQSALQGLVNLEDTQSQTQQRNATAQMNTARPVSAQEAAALGNPALEGSMMLPRDIGRAGTQAVKNTGAAHVIDQKDIATAAKNGQKPTYGAKGNVTGFEDDKDSPEYQSRTINDQVKKTQAALNQAKAAVAAAGNDPASPAYKLALAKANTAQQNASAAAIRANSYALTANGRMLGRDANGNPLNGIGTTPDNTPIGTSVQPGYTKAAGNLAKFQDVYSSLDNANAAIDAGDDAGVKFNTAAMTAALSDPKTTSEQWLTGKVNSTLSPQEQNLVITTKALREQIQAMRSSVGGGVSDSQVDRLVDQLPNATTPSLGYARKQLATVRQQLDRLQAGLPGVNNGPTLQRPGAPANPTNPGGVPNSIPKGNGVLIRKGNGEKITAQTAGAYVQKYGTREAARQAAQRDGWKF